MNCLDHECPFSDMNVQNPTEPIDQQKEKDKEKPERSLMDLVSEQMCRVFQGRYRIESEIGKGTFGVVFKAVNTQTGQHVAIKFIEAVKDPYAGRTEIAMLQQYQSPYLVKMIEYNHGILYTFIVFELLHVTFHEIVQNRKPHGLSLKQIAIMGASILEVLKLFTSSEDPSKHIIVGDIKPANLMLSFPLGREKQCLTKLIDLGIASFRHGQKNRYIQSRFYRAPEVLLGLYPFDPAIDMWSLGCTLFELFSCRVLFPGRNKHDQLFNQMMKLGIPPPHMLRLGSIASRFFTFQEVPFCSPSSSFHSISDSFSSLAVSASSSSSSLASFLSASSSICPSSSSFSPSYYLNNGQHEIFLRPEFKKELNKPDLSLPQLLLYYANKQDYASPTGLLHFTDLLSKMLTFDPKRRITPVQALCHPFFRELFQQTNSPPPIDSNKAN